MSEVAFPYDLVSIVWLDASGETDFKAESDIKEDHTVVTSIAFLLRKTKKHYLTGASFYWNEEDQQYHVGDRNHIPRGMVRSITVLIPKNKSPEELPPDLRARIAPGGSA